MYALNKKHKAIFMKVRKVIWSCMTHHQLDVAVKMVEQFGREIGSESFKIDFYGHQVESAYKVLFQYVNKRRDEIQYSYDDIRNDKEIKFASQVLTP